jgi:hypothetical protein
LRELRARVRRVILSIDREGDTAVLFLKDTDLEWFKYTLAKLVRIEE